MKLLKCIILSITIFLFCLLIGCTNTENDSSKNADLNMNEKIVEENEDKENKDPLNEKNLDNYDSINEENQENNDIIVEENPDEIMPEENNPITGPDPVSFNYSVEKQSNHRGYLLNGIIRIDTFQDYLYFVTEYGSISDNLAYNVDFFVHSGLIIYVKSESSGSTFIEISSVILEDNNDITILVKRHVSMIGTCDMAYYQFVIEYEKPASDIKDVNIKYVITSHESKEFKLSDKLTKVEAKNFIEGNKDVIEDYIVYIKFLEKLNDPQNSETRLLFEESNQQNVKKYELERINGYLSVLGISPLVIVHFNSLDDIDLDLLLEIAQKDNLIEVTLDITYEVTTNN